MQRAEETDKVFFALYGNKYVNFIISVKSALK